MVDGKVLREITYAMRKNVQYDEKSARPEALVVLKNGNPDEVLVLRISSSSAYVIEKALPLTVENLRRISAD